MGILDCNFLEILILSYKFQKLQIGIQEITKQYIVSNFNGIVIFSFYICEISSHFDLCANCFLNMY